MKNQALLASRDELNAFTETLVALCQAKGTHHVVLRNGSVKEVQYVNDEELNEHAFLSTDNRLCWNADGSSVTSRNLDIIELV